MARFETGDLYIFFEHFFVCLPDDEYTHRKGTELLFRFL
jgi:hypothetical protein